jgi:biotin carboxyl carrier protein
MPAAAKISQGAKLAQNTANHPALPVGLASSEAQVSIIDQAITADAARAAMPAESKAKNHVNSPSVGNFMKSLRLGKKIGASVVTKITHSRAIGIRISGSVTSKG